MTSQFVKSYEENKDLPTVCLLGVSLGETDFDSDTSVNCQTVTTKAVLNTEMGRQRLLEQRDGNMPQRNKCYLGSV